MSFPQQFPGPQDDGILLLSSFGEMGKTRWRGTRHDQEAEITGAFRQVPGPWPGSRAVVPMPGGSPVNMVLNPSVETNDTGWYVSNCNPTRSSTQARFGSTSYRVETTSSGAYVWYCEGAGGYTSVSPSTTYTVSLWVYAAESGTAYIGWAEYNSGSTHLGNNNESVALKPGWQRIVHTGTTSATTVKVRPLLSNLANGVVYYLDGLQLEAGGLSPYCDGDQHGCTWTGTAHASTSNRTLTEVQYDTFAPLLSGEDHLSIRAVVQAPLDANSGSWSGSGYPVIYDIRDDSNSDRVCLMYKPSTDTFEVYINGDYRITSSAQSFEAGDWLDLLLTLDFQSDEYKLYLNGSQIGSDSTSLAAPVFDGSPTFNLGSAYAAGTYCGCFAIAEVAIWTKEITTGISDMVGNYLVDSTWDGPMPMPLMVEDVPPYARANTPDKLYWGWRTSDPIMGEGKGFVAIEGSTYVQGLSINEWINNLPLRICNFKWNLGDVQWNLDPGLQASTVTISSGADLTIKTTNGDDIVIQATGTYADTTIEAARRMKVSGKKVQILSNASEYPWGNMTNGDLYIKADDGITITNSAYDQDEDIQIVSGQNIILDVYAPNPGSGTADYVACNGQLRLYATTQNPLGPQDGAIWFRTDGSYKGVWLHYNGNYYKLDWTQQ